MDADSGRHSSKFPVGRSTFGIARCVAFDCGLIESPNKLMHSFRLFDLQSDQLIYVSLNVFAFTCGRGGSACVQVGVYFNWLLHSYILKHTKRRKLRHAENTTR
jgi:hypothetical protein